MDPNRLITLSNDSLIMSIINSLSEAIFTISLDYKITAFNKAAEGLTGFKAEDAIGMDCKDVFCAFTEKAGIDCRKTCAMKETFKTGKSITRRQQIINKSEKFFTVTATTNLLLNDNNKIIGGIEAFTDITFVEHLKLMVEKKKYAIHNFITKNKEMLDTLAFIKKISNSKSNVLLGGETGTGKGLIARIIHQHSKVNTGPFIHINCNTIPEGLLESELFGHAKGSFTGALKDRDGKFAKANKGTLFLDEIGDLTPTIQAKLLVAVETKSFSRVGDDEAKTVDLRIIASTNLDLEIEIKEGRFRKDLYYRLNVIPIKLPPLNQRREDIRDLIDHFVDNFNLEMNKTIKQVSEEAYTTLCGYSWPGNIRELESVIEYAMAHCSGFDLELNHLPPAFRLDSNQITDISLTKWSSHKPQLNCTSTSEEYEKIHRALDLNRWKKKDAAKYMGISRSTLWRLMKKYEIQ